MTPHAAKLVLGLIAVACAVDRVANGEAGGAPED